MLYSHLNEKLLGLKDIKIKSIVENSDCKEIYIEMPIKTHICPNSALLLLALGFYPQTVRRAKRRSIKPLLGRCRRNLQYHGLY